MAKTFNTRILLKKDTNSNWTQNDPVLLDGEMIIVTTDAGDVRMKIGDGTSTYTELPFTDEKIIDSMTWGTF